MWSIHEELKASDVKNNCFCAISIVDILTMVRARACDRKYCQSISQSYLYEYIYIGYSWRTSNILILFFIEYQGICN